MDELGHRVVIATAAQPSRAVESLPPTVLPLLEILQLQSAVEAAQCLHPRRALVRWGGRDRGAVDAGFIVDRQAFDALLLSASQEAGVGVLPAARMTALHCRQNAWCVPVGSEL